MKQKNRPWFLRNILMRVAAVFIAVMMWLLVTNSSNPTIVIQVSNVAVRLTNTDVLTDQGKVYQVLDGSDTISTVYITAPRTIADAIRSDNVMATADLREMTPDGNVRVRLYTNIYNNQIDSISGSSETVRLSVEDRKRETFTIQASTTGDPAEGYVVGDTTIEQNQLRVSGPESVVSSIVRAVATVDVSGATGNIYTDADIRLYDANDEQIDTSPLTMNISKVRVTVSILMTKDVHLGLVGVTGQPAAGYMLSGENSVVPDHVLIAGRASALAAVSEVMLPADAVNVSGRDATMVKQVNLADYLPENTRLAGTDTSGLAEISIGIVPKAYQSIQVSADIVELLDVPEGYLAGTPAAMEGGLAAPLNIRISGEESDVLGVAADQISAYADVGAALEEAGAAGEDEIRLTCDVRFVLPEGVEQEEPVTMTVVLIKEGE